jgi:hypothetical protein
MQNKQGINSPPGSGPGNPTGSAVADLLTHIRVVGFSLVLVSVVVFVSLRSQRNSLPDDATLQLAFVREVREKRHEWSRELAIEQSRWVSDNYDHWIPAERRRTHLWIEPTTERIGRRLRFRSFEASIDGHLLSGSALALSRHEWSSTISIPDSLAGFEEFWSESQDLVDCLRVTITIEKTSSLYAVRGRIHPTDCGAA